MDCSFKITCRACDCCFELAPKDFVDRENLECPNCSKKFPADDFQILKSAILSLKALKPKVGATPGLKDYHDGFNISLSLDGGLPF